MNRTARILSCTAAAALSVALAGSAFATTSSKAKKVKAAAPAVAAAAAMAAGAHTVKLSDSQLAMAQRVQVGRSECEFNQHVDVQPVQGHEGHFTLAYKNAKYNLVPEDSATGAVRLEDKKAGVMWLQIANKSMLMNSKIGQRMVDNCVHADQMAAAQAAGNAPQK
jgi:hypothetical protein